MAFSGVTFTRPRWARAIDLSRGSDSASATGWEAGDVFRGAVLVLLMVMNSSQKFECPKKKRRGNCFPLLFFSTALA
jgi:hypothetical protein